MRLAVVGGGWAGLSAAVEAVERGHAVTLFDMSAQVGGRARSVDVGDVLLDNGQHILIGAYVDTLALMRRVGADPDALLHRMPLALIDPDGRGLRLPEGAAMPAFVRGVLAMRGWPLIARLALLAAAGRWLLQGFRCAPGATVASLTRGLPACVQVDLIEPLCVAALNTPASQASAEVFLRVLKDALFAGAGSADLLLPRAPLRDLLPSPARHWLQAHGADVRLQQRVTAIEADGDGWRVNDIAADAVVLACSASESARLARSFAPDWAAVAEAFEYEPIVTVYLQCDGARLPRPIVALHAGPAAPAQFVFDHGALGGRRGLFAWVVSGARSWVDRGVDACVEATMSQAISAFAPGTWPTPPRLVRALTEKRATFLCTPRLNRPPTRIARGLTAAGDYIAGPYPATLEGAVRSGRAAIDALN